MNLTAVTTTRKGERFEITLTAPDSFESVLDVNEAAKRLRFALQREVDRAVEILTVSQKDAEIAKQGLVQAGKRGEMVKRQKIADPGLDQIAFAGTKESFEVPAPNKTPRNRKER